LKTFALVFAPEAQDDLVELYEYIAEHGSPMAAQRYTDAIVTYCESFASFAHRGTRRDDIRPGLRITNYRRRTVIAFEVDDAKGQVSILGVFYGGRDYERALGDAADGDEPSDPG
jgi:toxin ParE1/3/4